MGLGAYSTRKLPGPKCVTEIPAPCELLRLIVASLPLAPLGISGRVVHSHPSASAHLAGVRQHTIPLIGKRLTVSRAEGRRTTRVHAALAQLIHEVAHRQVFWHVLSGVQLPSGIQRVPASGNHLGGKRDVRGHDQVTRSYVLGDGMIGRIETGRHLESLDKGRRWGSERLIGDQRQQDPQPVGGPKQQVFDDVGTRIGINPNVHG
jgi:hypothetical protein